MVEEINFKKTIAIKAHYLGVSRYRGTPKWMVYNGKPENPIKMDDLGVPLFSETSISWFRGGID